MSVSLGFIIATAKDDKSLPSFMSGMARFACMRNTPTLGGWRSFGNGGFFDICLDFFAFDMFFGDGFLDIILTIRRNNSSYGIYM
jgi:hypothetical protein